MKSLGGKERALSYKMCNSRQHQTKKSQLNQNTPGFFLTLSGLETLVSIASGCYLACFCNSLKKIRIFPSELNPLKSKPLVLTEKYKKGSISLDNKDC